MILMSFASFIISADGGGGGLRGTEPQVVRFPAVLLSIPSRLSELFVKFIAKSRPSMPLSSADEGVPDRLTVVLFISVELIELFVRLLRSVMPSFPLS